MYILMVRLKVKHDHINDFIKASIADGTGSVLREPNCRRFDIIQDETDPTLFAFNEVYSDEAAFEHHKTTPHFKQWAEVVRHLAKINCPFTSLAEWCNSIRRGTYPASWRGSPSAAR